MKERQMEREGRQGGREAGGAGNQRSGANTRRQGCHQTLVGDNVAEGGAAQYCSICHHISDWSSMESTEQLNIL